MFGFKKEKKYSMAEMNEKITQDAIEYINENIEKTPEQIQSEHLGKIKCIKTYEKDEFANVTDDILQDNAEKIDLNSKEYQGLMLDKIEYLMNKSAKNREILSQLTTEGKEEELEKIADYAIKYDKLYEKVKDGRAEFYRHCLKEYINKIDEYEQNSLLFSFGKEKYLEGVEDKDYAKKESMFEMMPYKCRTMIGAATAISNGIERLASSGLGRSRAEIKFLRYCDEKAREESLNQTKEIAKQLQVSSQDAMDIQKMNKLFTTAGLLFGMPRINFTWSCFNF